MPAANPACGLPWTTRKVGQFATGRWGCGVFGFLTPARARSRWPSLPLVERRLRRVGLPAARAATSGSTGTSGRCPPPACRSRCPTPACRRCRRCSRPWGCRGGRGRSGRAWSAAPRRRGRRRRGKREGEDATMSVRTAVSPRTRPGASPGTRRSPPAARRRARRHDLLAVLVLDRRLLGGHLERRPHALLRQPDAPGRPGGDLLGRLERALEQPLVVDDRRRRARSAPPPRRSTRRPVSISSCAREAPISRGSSQLDRHVAVRHADVDEGGAEHRAARRVADVAAEREREAEARGRPVDGGDHRLRRRAQPQDQPRHVLLVAEAVARRVACRRCRARAP